MASASSATSLLNSAKSYIGTPYKWGGTTTSGFDCSGFIQKSFKDVGISLPRTTGQQYATGTAVAKNKLQAGDLVFFNTNGKGVSHAGIYIGSNNFIHASTSKGVMISSINDPYYWGSRYIGAKRVKNFNEVAVTPPAPKPIPAPSRADIAVVLADKLDLPTTSTDSVFSDVSNQHPQLGAIAAVAAAGIFTGSNGSFNPDGQLTRAQLAKVLVEAFGLEGTSGATFTDVPATHWAKDYIAILAHNEITTGYADGRFGVNDYVTLSQLNTFIDRINK